MLLRGWGPRSQYKGNAVDLGEFGSGKKSTRAHKVQLGRGKRMAIWIGRSHIPLHTEFCEYTLYRSLWRCKLTCPSPARIGLLILRPSPLFPRSVGQTDPKLVSIPPASALHLRLSRIQTTSVTSFLRQIEPSDDLSSHCTTRKCHSAFSFKTRQPDLPATHSCTLLLYHLFISGTICRRFLSFGVPPVDKVRITLALNPR